MKTSTQVTVTPLLLQALEHAIRTMDSYAMDESLNREAKQDNVVGEVCRGTLADNVAYQNIVESFIKNAREQLNR